MKKVSIKILARSKLPALPLEALARTILGAHYRVSLVCVGDVRSRRWNALYRKRDRPTNILSFPLSKTDGELVVNVRKIKKEAAQLRVPLHDYSLYLIAHGMLHLRGFDHGTKMEQEEVRSLQKFVAKSFLTWLTRS